MLEGGDVKFLVFAHHRVLLDGVEKAVNEAKVGRHGVVDTLAERMEGKQRTAERERYCMVCYSMRATEHVRSADECFRAGVLCCHRCWLQRGYIRIDGQTDPKARDSLRKRFQEDVGTQVVGAERGARVQCGYLHGTELGSNS